MAEFWRDSTADHLRPRRSGIFPAPLPVEQIAAQLDAQLLGAMHVSEQIYAIAVSGASAIQKKLCSRSAQGGCGGGGYNAFPNAKKTPMSPNRKTAYSCHPPSPGRISAQQLPVPPSLAAKSWLLSTSAPIKCSTPRNRMTASSQPR